MPFFYVRIVKGPKTNICTCKLFAWVIFIILFTRLLCDNSNSLTYEPRKGAKTLFTWSGEPRSSGVSFFCFHALGDTKQKKLTPLDRGPPLHINRPKVQHIHVPAVWQYISCGLAFHNNNSNLNAWRPFSFCNQCLKKGSCLLKK